MAVNIDVLDGAEITIKVVDDAAAVGPQGVPGINGKTVLNGTADPGSAVGTNGDFYINTATSFIFGPKTGGAWGHGVSLVGPQGAQGIQGVQGIQGMPGADGRTVLSGAIAPGSGVGVNGDFYINTATSFIYGPKAGGAWPAGVSLVGATGATGATGANGLDGKTVLNGTVAPGAGVGTNGDFYINTTSSTLYGPKASGAWPAGVSLVGPTGPAGAGSGDVVGPASSTNNRLAIFNGATGKLIADSGVLLSQVALLSGPTFTGVPLAPTAAADTNTTQIATTAHVFAERANAATLTNKTLTSPQLNSPKLNAVSIVGHVWTAIDTVGNGTWSASSGGGGSDWSLVGNSGTTPGASFFGTTDAARVDIRAENKLKNFVPTGYTAAQPALGTTVGGSFVINACYDATVRYGLLLGADENGFGYIQSQNHSGPFAFPLNLNARGGNVNIGTLVSSPSALLNLESTTQGLGLMGLTTTQINAIPTPKTGLLLFNITLGLPCVYNGTSWQRIPTIAM